jgi:branched-chain amino acid transport system ATP-binding protein
VQGIFQTLQDLKKEGFSILLVEQKMRAAFALADRHYVLSKGQVCFSGPPELDGNESVMREYLGVYGYNMFRSNSCVHRKPYLR